MIYVRQLQCWRLLDFEHQQSHLVTIWYTTPPPPPNSLQVLSGSSWSFMYWHLRWYNYRIFEVTEYLSALMWLKPAILVSLAKTLGYCWKNTLIRLICHFCTQKRCMAVTIITGIEIGRKNAIFMVLLTDNVILFLWYTWGAS